MTLECIRYLREQYPHIIISVEIEKPTETGLEKLIPEADILFFSRDWAEVGSHDRTRIIAIEPDIIQVHGFATPEKCLLEHFAEARRA